MILFFAPLVNKCNEEYYTIFSNQLDGGNTLWNCVFKKRNL